MESGKESVCLNGCMMKHMLAKITSTQVDECFYGPEFQLENERFRQGGLGALTGDDKEILFDWYKDNFAWKCENDEPDEATLREWAADRQIQLSEYYQMVSPA